MSMSSRDKSQWQQFEYLVALWLSAALTGCGLENEKPQVVRVIPETVSVLGRTNTIVEGRNFFVRGEFDADAQKPDRRLSFDTGFTVSIGTIDIKPPDVTFLDPEHLAVVLPAGLPAGYHDVRVRRPDGRVSEPAPGALTVVDSAVGLTLSIEDGAGGTGSPFEGRQLTAGDSLTVYAVLRDDLGTFVSDAEAIWAVSGDIGTIAEGPATSSVFVARRVGAGCVGAVHTEAGEAVTGPLTVVAAAPTRVYVEGAPSDAGHEVNDLLDLTTDDTLVLYAVARDAFGNFVSDEVGTWGLTGDDIGTIQAGPSSSTQVDLQRTGAARVTIQHATLQGDETGNLVVGSGTLVKVRIESTPGGTGIETGSLTLIAGNTLTVYAVGYDLDGNYTGDVPVTWSVTGGIGPVGISPPATYFELHAVAVGVGQIVATSNNALGDSTGDIVINAGVPDRIVVETAPDGIGSEVRDVVLTADEATTFYAVARDQQGNFIRNISTHWQWLFGCEQLGGLDRPEGYSVTFEPTRTGSCWLAATHDTFGSDVTGKITVTHGLATTIVIEDKPDGSGAEIGPLTMTSSGPSCLLACTPSCGACSFYAVGRDEAGNFAGLQAASWQLIGDIGILDTANGTGVTLTAGQTGIGMLAASVTNLGSDFTGDIDVIAGPFSHVAIEDGPGGSGDALTRLTVTKNGQLVLYAAARDSAGSYVADACPDVQWHVDGTIGTINGATVGCAITFAAAAVSGQTVGRIWIDKPGWGAEPPNADYAIDVVTVNDGVVDTIFVSDDPESCTTFADGTYTADDRVKVYAVGCNGTTFLGLVDADTWSLSGDNIGNLSAVSGISTKLDLTNVGGARIALSDTLGNAVSGQITVLPGVLHHVVIENAGGNEVTDLSMAAGNTVVFSAAGRDRDGNRTGNVAVGWGVQNGIGTLVCVGGDCAISASAALTATRVGTGYVVAAHPTAGTDATGTITVAAGPAVGVGIHDGPGGLGHTIPDQVITADDSLALHAVELDAYGNWVADTVVLWALDPGMDPIGVLVSGPDTSTLFDAVTASPVGGRISASHPAFTTAYTGVIKVMAGSPVRLAIETAPAGQGREVGGVTLDSLGTMAMFAVARDEDGNFVSDESATWAVSGGIGAVSPGPATSVTFQATIAGQGVVTAVNASLPADSTGIITVGCVVYVDVDSTASAPDGRAWSRAYKSVLTGVTAAKARAGSSPNGRCEVWVAEGVYYLYTSGRTNTLAMQTKVDLYGGFVGNEKHRGPQRDWNAHQTTLDGGNNSTHSLQVYHVVTGSNDAVLDGFVITKGNASGSLSSDQKRGGGMYNYGVSPVVRNCLFTGNSAIDRGGGMNTDYGSPHVESCRFVNNIAANGGGAYNEGQSNSAWISPTFIDCTFEGNQATDGTFGGGGMYNNQYAATYIEGCTFRLNETNGSGGGMRNYTSSAPQIVDSLFLQNSAQVNGGGVHTENANVSIAGVTFRQNAADGEGGGVYSQSSSVDIRDTAFLANSAGTRGGAVMDDASDSQVESCLFARNRAGWKGQGGYAGGLYARNSSQPRVANCTFSLNEAETYGGAVRLYAGAQLTLVNSISWSNSAATGNEIYTMGSTPIAGATVTHSDIAGGQAGTGNINSNPLFFDANRDWYYLAAGSPCIDAANGSAATAADIDGTPRVDDSGTANTGAGNPPYVDIGAYEYLP